MKLGPFCGRISELGTDLMHVTPHDFRDVQQLIRSLCGLVLSDEKTYLVRSRLESVVNHHGCATFGDYLKLLQQPNAALMRDELVEELTTGETSFNRDGHPFDEFRMRIMPSLAEVIRQRRQERYPIPLAKIWSAGCSTGQEPYSLAIAVREYLAGVPSHDLRPEHFPILATDVSAKSLKVCREGRYSERELIRGLTPTIRARYFHQSGDFWIVDDAIRSSIDFRRLNFIDRAGNLGPFDIILCRNVMIYFDAETRQRLCDQFYEQLMPGGLLMLGSVENLYGLKTPFISEQVGNTVVHRKPKG